MSLIFTLAGNTTSLELTAANNVNQQNQIFVESGNDLTLTVTNNSGKPVTLSSGKPVPLDPPNQQLKTTAYFYLILNSALRGVVDMSSATLTTGDGNTWNIVSSYSDAQNGQYYALCPQTDIDLTAASPGNSFALSLTGITGTSTCNTGTITLEYFIGGVVDFSVENVQVVNPPPPALIDLQLVASFAGTYTIPVAPSDADFLPASTLILMLTNPGSAALVPGGYASWSGNSPVFTINFQYDNTDGGLTDDPTSLNVSLLDDFGNNWPNSLQQGQTASPYWTFTLLNDGSPLPHGDVIGTGDNQSITFSISGIQSAAAIGVTPCIISWTGIPGYYDGQMAIDIVKVEPVTVNISSNLSNNTIDLTQTPVSAELSISASNANTVMIMNTDFFQVLPSGSVSSEAVPINPNITTTYTAIATNFSTAQQASASVTVTVTPDTYTLFPKQTIVMWSGDPSNLPPGWALCIGGTMPDGTTAIPDLQDRFVVGLGPVLSGSQPNQTGGTFSHSHGLTISTGAIMNSNTPIDGSHYHKSTFRTTMMVSSGHTSHYMVMFGNDNNGTSYASSTPGQNYSVSTNAANNAGAHYHTLPPENTTMTTNATNTQPPWYSLAFIIKTF